MTSNRNFGCSEKFTVGTSYFCKLYHVVYHVTFQQRAKKSIFFAGPYSGYPYFGFDAERGDVITLKTMELPTVEPEGTTAEGGSFLDLAGVDVMQLAQVAILALVALVLGLFVVRPILAAPPTALPMDPAPALPPADGGSGYSNAALDGEIDGGSDGFLPPLMGGMDDGIGGLPPLDGSDDSPADRLRNLIGERQAETIEILRNWLEDEENA